MRISREQNGQVPTPTVKEKPLRRIETLINARNILKSWREPGWE
jgi:hypothetical protein